MDNGHYNNYYGGDNENNQKIPNIDNLMGSLSLSENSYQDNDVQTNIPPQNQNISKLPLFPKKMFYIDTASYQSTVSSDSYSDGFSPAVSQTQSPTYYGSTTNAVNSFSNISSNVSSPTFFSVPNNQTELLQLQLGSNFTPGTIQISKPDPPKPPAIISNDDGFVYQVQFKRTSRYYIRLPSYNQEIKLNDYVKVYADRGEDLGQVKSMITPNMFYELKNQHGRFVAKDDENIWELKYISRLASTFEKKQLATKANEENQVYQFANRLVGVYNLQLVIVDVEYQFDRHKLTVMYECNKRVDFREFVRDLFAEYKTRIWMQQVSNSKTNSTGPSPSSVSHGISPMISPAGYVNNGQVKSMMSNNYNLPTQPRKAFPSDIHAVISQIQLHGYNPNDALIEIHPKEAHAVGNVPVQLHDWGVDFACWCTYKYMNCGPGSIGGCFIHEKHGEGRYIESDSNEIYPRLEVPRLSGWWGHRVEDRFLMASKFIPAKGANGFRVSNAPVLLIACVRASLDIFDEANIYKLREKSILLTNYLELLLESIVKDKVFIFTPKDSTRRGCQLSLSFNCDVDIILNELKKNGIICDARKPNVIRIAPTPLYNSFVDVYEFVHILKSILDSI
eukprot:gene17605-23178_t